MGSSKAAAAASMKVHQIARGLWAAASPDHEPSGLSLAAAASCKRLRPLAPKHSAPESPAPTAFDLKSFIRPESGPRKLGCSSPDSHVQGDSPPVETHHQGGTRWNPTQEQIGILEMLYRSGMRTPNAQQIEHITAQLRKYGKIEGKNVFYWFQNHKARERQKQKRINLGLGHCPRTPTSPTTVITAITLSSTTTSREESEVIRDEDSPFKRNCRSWAFEFLEEDHSKVSCRDHQAAGREDRTLELFPLHPEGIRLLL